MRILITRGRDDAAPLAAELEARGHEALIEPMLDIVPARGSKQKLLGDLTSVQGLLFTSANGVRAFARLTPSRGYRVFAVGDATAAAARDAGFARVESAAGDVEALADLVLQRLRPEHGALFHAAASQLAGDLQGRLEAAGFQLRRAVLYEAQPASSLSEEIVGDLRAGRIDAVLFFSPRTAKTFVTLVREGGLAPALARCTALCLSEAVAEEVRTLAWAGVHPARQPTKDSLLETLDRLAATGAQVTEGRAAETMAESETNDDVPAQADTAPAGPAALAVISAFGGIRPMATKLGIAVTTVQGWRERAVIPARRHADILAAAQEHGIDIDGAVLEASGQPPEAEAPPSRPAPPPSSAATRAASAMPPAEPKEKPAAEAPPPIPPAPVPPPEPPRSTAGAWLGGLVLGALLLGGGAGGAVATRDLWLPYLGATAPAGEAPASAAETEAALARLESEIAGLAGKLDALGGQVADLGQRPAADPAAIPALEAALAELEARLAEAEARPAEAAGTETADLSESVAELSARLERVEEQAAAPGPIDPGVMEQLSAKEAALAARVAALEEAAGAPSVAPAELATVTAQNEELAARLAAAETRVAALDETAQGLSAELAAQAEAGRAGLSAASADSALTLAVGQLRDALRLSGPFAAELAVVTELVADDAELSGLLAPLAAHAEAGLPTPEALRGEFQAAARNAASAGRGDEAEGLLSGVMRRVSQVVTVRPVGQVDGAGAGAVLARAENKLAGDDLAGAVAELDALQDGAAAAMADWRRRAEGRLAADAAVAELGTRAIAKLAGAGG